MYSVYAPLVASGPPRPAPPPRPTPQPPTDGRGIVHGLGVPPQYTDPATWQFRHAIPFFNWSEAGPQSAMFTPMSWAGHPIAQRLGGDVLLFNEPEISSQGNLDPAVMVYRLQWWADWPGRVIVGGWHYWTGRAQAEAVLRLGAGLPMVDALHLHVYDHGGGVDVARLRWWREFADGNGWPLWVTEWGFHGVDERGIVAQIPGLYNLIADVLRPERMYYFSWSYADFWPAGDAWRAGEWTEVGHAWRAAVGLK